MITFILDNNVGVKSKALMVRELIISALLLGFGLLSQTVFLNFLGYESRVEKENYHDWTAWGTFEFTVAKNTKNLHF